MSKGQRASLYTALAAYGSAAKVAASSAPQIAPIVYTTSSCEALTKAAEATTGLARQQVLAVLSQMMQNRSLFSAAPKMERFQGLRIVLAKAQALYKTANLSSSGAISALLSLFACLDHPGLDTTTWSHEGRMRIMPVFNRTATMACLKPLTDRQLTESLASAAAAAEAEEKKEETDDAPKELSWPEPSEQVMMLMGAGFQRHHVEFCLLQKDGNPDLAVDMLLGGSFYGDLPSEQDLIKQITGQGDEEKVSLHSLHHQ